MGTEGYKAPTAEEVAQFENERTLSDAEIIKGGGGKVPENGSGLTFELTEEQKQEAKTAMHEDISSKFLELRNELSEKEKEIADLKMKLEQALDTVEKNAEAMHSTKKPERTRAGIVFGSETLDEYEEKSNTEDTESKSENFNFADGLDLRKETELGKILNGDTSSEPKSENFEFTDPSEKRQA